MLTLSLKSCERHYGLFSVEFRFIPQKFELQCCFIFIYLKLLICNVCPILVCFVLFSPVFIVLKTRFFLQNFVIICCWKIGFGNLREGLIRGLWIPLNINFCEYWNLIKVKMTACGVREFLTLKKLQTFMNDVQFTVYGIFFVRICVCFLFCIIDCENAKTKKLNLSFEEEG
jgi:hypothetical protein